MKTLGKFEIIDRLGQGAMGVVYKARDPLIGRLVALKTITTGLAEDPALLERFYREAHSAGALQHPNIVTIYELGEADKTPFIAMEYLAGQSLDKLIESRPMLPLSQKVGYVAYVCRALSYAHKQGVVHRDVKPGNVMVTNEGTVKVVDFGIASIAENSKSQSGLLIGTLGYMSPQQLEGRRADAKSDIWAAGVLFYELLTHRRPFDGENYGALMLNIMTQDVPPLSETAPGTPPDVAAVIDRMLRKDPDERFQSMEEALIDLEPVWRGLQRSEVSDLLAASQEMLNAGDAGKAYETVRRVLQIDTANSQAKTLLETINAEIRRTRTSPLPEMKPTGDETMIVPAPGKDATRPSPSSIPALTASRAQSAPVQSGSAGDTASRLRAAVSQRSVPVQPELPPPAPAPAAAPKRMQPMLVALLTLGVVIVGGATYFFEFRRQGAPTLEANVEKVASDSNTLSRPDVSNVPAAVPAPASGAVASADLEKRQQPPIASPAGTKSPVRDSANNADTNKSVPVTSVPQPSRDQGATGLAATPPASNRTEVAVNNTAPPPGVERPAQPVAPNPQPAVPASQPPVASTPTPAPKAADPVPASKPAEPTPAAATPASTSPDSLDRQAITVTLQQFSAAFSHRSMPEVEAIWPKKGPEMNNLKKVFDNTKSLTREFHLQSLNISSGGDTATAIGSYDGKFVDSRGVESPSSGNFYVRLAKKNGRWFIDDASF